MSEMVVKYNNPSGLAKPLGAYSHIARARASELLFTAGQLAVNEAGELVGKGDFAAQMSQIFDNLGRALETEGLGFANVTKFTTYLVHSQDIEAFMTVRKETLHQDISGRSISAQYFADGRSAGRRTVPDRDRGNRGGCLNWPLSY